MNYTNDLEKRLKMVKQENEKLKLTVKQKEMVIVKKENEAMKFKGKKKISSQNDGHNEEVESTTPIIGKKHALKKYDQFVQNTSFFSQERIFAISIMAKNPFLPQKKVKNYQKSWFFFQSENCNFGSFELFSGAKIDFLPFFKRQIMFFCTFEIALFF